MLFARERRLYRGASSSSSGGIRCGPSVGGTLGGFSVARGGLCIVLSFERWGVWGTLGSDGVCFKGGEVIGFFWASSENMSLNFWMACNCRSPRAS